MSSSAPVDNASLRAAVEAFATNPEQSTHLDVVRGCFRAQLLLDSTGSDRPTVEADGSYSFPAGPTSAISHRDVAFAVRGDRNDAAKAALEITDPPVSTLAVLDVLADNGLLLFAVDTYTVFAHGVSDGPSMALSADELHGVLSRFAGTTPPAPHHRTTPPN